MADRDDNWVPEMDASRSPEPPQKPDWTVGFNWRAGALAMVLAWAIWPLDVWRIAVVWAVVYALREVWRD